MKAAFLPGLLLLYLLVTSSVLAQSENGPTGDASGSAAPADSSASGDNNGRVASLAVSDLRDYEAQPQKVRQLLAAALALTTRNLTYKYGSSDPENGGMDCSGTIYYLLNAAGLPDVPRDASEMYQWVWTKSRFQAVNSSSPDTFELGPLKPGDLLFWTGTYHVDRDPPITHVMIYLGLNRHTGQRVMVGASDGRRYEGKSRYGVSVFDFSLPGRAHASSSNAASPSESSARFIGYGKIPGLLESGK